MNYLQVNNLHKRMYSATTEDLLQKLSWFVPLNFPTFISTATGFSELSILI